MTADTPAHAARNTSRILALALGSGTVALSVLFPQTAQAQSNEEFLRALNSQMASAYSIYNDGMQIAARGLQRQQAEREQLLRAARRGNQAAAAEYRRRVERQQQHALAVWGGAAAAAEAQARRAGDFYSRQYQQQYHDYVQSRDRAVEQGRAAGSRGDYASARRYAAQAEYYGQKASEYRGAKQR